LLLYAISFIEESLNSDKYSIDKYWG